MKSLPFRLNTSKPFIDWRKSKASVRPTRMNYIGSKIKKNRNPEMQLKNYKNWPTNSITWAHYTNKNKRSLNMPNEDHFKIYKNERKTCKIQGNSCRGSKAKNIRNVVKSVQLKINMRGVWVRRTKNINRKKTATFQWFPKWARWKQSWTTATCRRGRFWCR